MRVLVVVFSKAWDLCEPLRQAGVEAEALCCASEARSERIRWARRILAMDMNEFDVVFSQGGGGIGLLTMLAAKKYGCLTAIRFRGDPWQEYESQVKQGSKSRLKGAFDGWAARRSVALADIMLPVSTALGGWIRERTGCDARRIVPVPIPVNCTRFDVAGKVETLFDFQHSHLITLVTLFQFRQKIAGLERFLPVLRAIVENHDAGVVIAGDGPLREKFMLDNSQLLSHPRIHLPGYVDSMPALYSQSDIVCHFSLLDGCPAVPLEAWCCGLPVVVNDYAPLLEHIEPGVNGYVLRADADVGENLRIIERLLIDSEHRQKLGENGRRMVNARFSPAAIGAQLRTALEGAMQRGTGKDGLR